MIASNKGRLVKEGYLDVKVPPGNRERKLWKAWQRRFLVSVCVEEPCGLELRIYGCQKTNCQPLWTVFISPESGKLYRSRSRTHAWAFSIAHEMGVFLHLAGESEQLSQSWMACIRDALWPPSPLVQVEAAFQDVHRVSLIDDENTCRSELFGAYGHLYMAGDVILLMSTHSGRLMKEWRLGEILKAEVERLDEGKTSGVFSLTIHRGSSQHGDKLHFYSQTATSIVENISSALKMRQEGKVLSSSQPTPKYDSGIQELSELLNLENKGVDNGNSCNFEEWSSGSLSEGFSSLAAMSGDFLNCSINSVFSPRAYSLSSSDASSDYSPPVSPMDPSSPNPDRTNTRCSSKDLDNFYCETNVKVRRNSLEDIDLYDALMLSHRSSTTSDIYTDISSLPPSKRPSIAETLYEDIEEDDEEFVKLMDEIMEDEYMPPLPPPRNAHSGNTRDPTVERPSSTAKRPSTLDLENLSSSISATLSQVQTLRSVEPNYKMTKGTFSTGLFKPIKGVKRILSNKKSPKSHLVSPTKENIQNNDSSAQICTPETKEIVNAGCYPSVPLLITTDAELLLEGSSNNSNSYSDTENSSVLTPDDHFVPFPELLTSAVSCDKEQHPNRNEQCNSCPSAGTSSVALRNSKKGEQTRDSLLVESLKSKFSGHQDFLQFLHTDQQANDKHDSCPQHCFHRSVSLEQLPRKSLQTRRHNSCSSRTFCPDLVINLKNGDSLPGISSTESHIKKTSVGTTAVQCLLSRRRSSDYCAMNSVVSPNGTNESELDIYTSMHSQNEEAEMRKEPLGQEWSDSLQKQVTEYEPLYVDMTLNY